MDTLTSNIISYSRLFEEFFATLPGQSLFFGIFAVFFFLGLAARFKADLLFVLYAVLYLIVLWTWPEWQGYRFLFPMLPFFIYFAMQGIRVTLDKVGGNQKTILQKGAPCLPAADYNSLCLQCRVECLHQPARRQGNQRAF